MVLALKPFGCMPSSQSDGVQSAVVNKFKDMIFLPIETSGEGEVNAHSRVQMALGEAKVKAGAEFEQCLKSTGKSLDEIRDYVDEHPELKRPFYQVPHREGVAGTAAQFILHVSDRMDKSTRLLASRSRAWDRAFRTPLNRSQAGGAACAAGPLTFPRSILIGEIKCTTIRMDMKAGAPTISNCACSITYQKPHDHHTKFLVGLDVGSTTVKAIVVDAATDKTIWQDYQRHETRQPEKMLEFLRRMEAEAGINRHNTRIFITGSGGGTIAEMIGAKFVQEVHAVSLAVEKLHPEVYSVIELGGQDAKIIVFKDDEETGRKKKIPSMNDKCAGGTGAVIDKINAKLKIPAAELANQGYHGIKLHKVAGKCGVFAETDINGLQKDGTPPDELMASLFEAIVLQNLSVLTRGHTLRPHVLLLGGPNSFIRGMREAWQANIPRMWKERKVEIPEGAKPEELIKVPENAQYFAALGAVEFGKSEEDGVGCYQGYEKLVYYIDYGRAGRKGQVRRQGPGRRTRRTRRLSKNRIAARSSLPPTFQKGQTVAGFIGIDGGSTSTKAVLLDENGEILCKTYQLSNGNPIQDTIEMFEKLRGQVEAQRRKLEVLGVATTGYAKDILKDVSMPTWRWSKPSRTPNRR